MNIKKQIKNIVVSGIISFLVLNLICFFYYNVPPRAEAYDGSSDYKWPSNSFYSAWIEGGSFGIMNNDGYNNINDYNNNLAIDVLMLGSSHLEGRNVKQKDNMCEIFNSISDYYSYNVGVSEHTLPICISNLENAIKKYRPKKYVVIETMNVSFYDAEIKDSLSVNREKLPTYSGGIMDILQHFKYLKLIRYQLVNTKIPDKVENINNYDLLEQLLDKAKKICEDNDIKLIILYHPSYVIDEHNVLSFKNNEDDLKMFSEICKEKEIIFVNMEDTFKNNYYEDYTVAYGFGNTTPGAGHLNKYGHNMIANKLKEIIEENENDVQ